MYLKVKQWEISVLVKKSWTLLLSPILTLVLLNQIEAWIEAPMLGERPQRLALNLGGPSQRTLIAYVESITEISQNLVVAGVDSLPLVIISP